MTDQMSERQRELYTRLDAVDLNQALEPWCLDHEIEIAWDQWARVRIFCVHGTAEGVSGGLCLNRAFAEAIESWKAIDHSSTLCWADCDPPQEWKDEPNGEFWWDNTTDCELVRGHDGDHKCFPSDEEKEAYLYQRIVYFKNGHDRTGTPVFGSTTIPHPYLKSVRALASKKPGGTA